MHRPTAPTTAASDGIAVASAAIPRQAAFAVVALESSTLLAEAHREVLDTPVLPGSLMKIVMLAAAAEQGVVDDRTRIACPRRLRVGDRVLDCAHPDLGRPLGPREALAHSCNGFFATIAPRVPAPAIVMAARALGLPAPHRAGEQVLFALGLDDYRVAPRAWMSAVAGIAGIGARPPLAPATVALLRDGLADAARVGTASSAGPPAGSAWAKTGTAPMPGGGVEGLAVLVTARLGRSLAAVVVAPGAAGRDAAAIGVDLLRRHADTEAGAIAIGITRGDGHDVQQIGLEAYVSQVVAAEAPPDAPTAVRHALAIVARTYALRHRGRHAAEGFDLCDLTHCQAMRAPNEASREVAAATVGQVLYEGPALADVYYSVSCGGTMVDARALWAGDDEPRESFVERPDPAGSGADEVHWTADISALQMRAILSAAGLQGSRLDDVRVIARTTAGRVHRLHVSGLHPDMVDGEAFRLASGRVIGWRHVKSNWFHLTRTATGYRLTGRGHGHGVGLCVRGAVALAATRDATAILAAYFPSAIVDASGRERDSRDRRSSSPRTGAEATKADLARSIRLVLPAEEESRRPSLTSIVHRALRSVAGRLGVPTSQVSVRFHPTVASYQRATGQAWWTAGRAGPDRIDLLPVDVLERRGQLERTLRHELVHWLTRDELADTPLWVREGVAHYFASPPGTWAAVDTTAGCPADADFASTTDGDALRALYDRAATCVASALGRGQAWKALR